MIRSFVRDFPSKRVKSAHVAVRPEDASKVIGVRPMPETHSLKYSNTSYNVGPSLILAPPAPLTIGPPEKSKIDVLNKDPTVRRAPGGLGDYLQRDGLVSVPYF